MGADSPVTAVILVAGPQKGTRFRPLSLEVPKPLFPVAGCALLEHHIRRCSMVSGLREIILLGYYQADEQIGKFMQDMRKKYNLDIQYLQEYKPLGTCGGIYHFRDQILSRGTEALIVIHTDIICEIPLGQMLEQFRERCAQTENISTGVHLVLGTRATQSQTSEHGNMVLDERTNEVTHYVEKPESFVSPTINCGVYIFHPSIFDFMTTVYRDNVQQARDQLDEGDSTIPEQMFIGRHLFTAMAGTKKVYCFMLNGFWGSMKSAGSALFANRQYLSVYRKCNESSEKYLAHNGPGKPEIIGDVFIHPSAVVDPTAKLGPNVSIGSNCLIGSGARVRESIILDNAELREQCCVLNSIIGWRCLVGAWARVEGTANDPNPNFPNSLVPNESLFHADGKLIPSATVLGCNVVIPREVIVLNCIVLPHKELSGSYKNQIIL